MAVLGLSSSSQAGLLAEIDRLGTNMLTVQNGTTLFGQPAELPRQAPAMIGRIGGRHRRPTNRLRHRRRRLQKPLVPTINTNALQVQAASLGLLQATGDSLQSGTYLNAATATEPVAVLGAVAAQRLGIDHVFPGERIWLDNQWFYLAGILKPAILAPQIDTTALVGFPAAEKYLGFDGHPSTIYVRAETGQVAPSNRSSPPPPTPNPPTRSTSANPPTP